MVLNAAARLVVGASRRDHVSPVLHDVLHWLPVTQKIQFKIAATAFDCVRGIGLHTSKTSAPQRSTPPVEQTSFRLIAVTCLSREPRHSCSADEASMLLFQLSGTVFLFIALAIHQSRTIQSWVDNPSLQ